MLSGRILEVVGVRRDEVEDGKWRDRILQCDKPKEEDRRRMGKYMLWVGRDIFYRQAFFYLQFHVVEHLFDFHYDTPCLNTIPQKCLTTLFL